MAGIERRHWPATRVTCVTCHAGRVDPRPIEEVLAGAYEAAGADSVAVLYRILHGRYFGSDAYDLRVGTLSSLAAELAEDDSYDDALLLSAVNEETHPDEPSARRLTLMLRGQRALDEVGVAAALAEFAAQRATESAEVLSFSIMDQVGWRTFRLGLESEGLSLFRANREAYPNEYFTFESLIEARHAAGEISRDEIIAGYRNYLREHPENSMAQAQLTNHERDPG